ncbi:hypothetical protein AgCh_031286 [Apium graveolens]
MEDGYLVRVEELMAAKLPMADMKANPHIESRWKYLKRKYNAIADMRGSSGFGWDETNKKANVIKAFMTNGVRVTRMLEECGAFRFHIFMHLDN